MLILKNALANQIRQEQMRPHQTQRSSLCPLLGPSRPAQATVTGPARKAAGSYSARGVALETKAKSVSGSGGDKPSSFYSTVLPDKAK
jgi:hypothetical protein